MMASTSVSVGGAGMLRTRRRDVSVKPNRKLDRKSSRGMIYENEELRLRTIHINAEVEQGQNDIKKLRRENEQLRREIWSLRDEYDKLEEILKRQQNREESEEYEDRSEEGDDLQSDYSCEEEEEADGKDSNDETSEDCNSKEQLENVENDKISSEKMSSNSLHRLHVDFDDLSVVDEEEELKKDKEKKEVILSEEIQQQKNESKNFPMTLRPRQLHENIPFYPSAYEPSNTVSSTNYYSKCPFEFPSTVDLMLPTDTAAILASPCSRLHADPLIPLASMDAPNLEQVASPMLPQIHVPPVGWQANVVLTQEQLGNYPTMNVTPSTGIQMIGANEPLSTSDVPVDQQRLTSAKSTVSLSKKPNFVQRRKKLEDLKPLEGLRIQQSHLETQIIENGWHLHADSSGGSKVSDQNVDSELKKAEHANLGGIFTFGGSEKPKHFFSPLPSKIKKQPDEGSPTTSTSQFGTGTSSSSGKTGSTVISKSHFMTQKGSADIYVNGAIPYGQNTLHGKDEQKPFLSNHNLLVGESRSNTMNQFIKSVSCQDLTDAQTTATCGQLRTLYAEGKPQMFTQSDNTLDSISSETTSKPYKSHLNVTLKKPGVNQAMSPEAPEIPNLPSIDYRLFNNPFLKSFDPTCQHFSEQESPITRPLSIQVNDENPYYHYSSPNVSTFNRKVLKGDGTARLRGQVDHNRLLIPSNQLTNGKLMSPLNKHEVQITSFERPSPHTLVSPGITYDLNTLRRMNANPYLQSRNLYQNVPFIPGRNGTQFYPHHGSMRLYYENQTPKVSTQTQTSIDGDSHQGDEQILSQQDADSVGTPSSPSGQQRKRTVKKDKDRQVTKDQNAISPAAQRRLKKQSSVTSSETTESPDKLTRKRPRKLSVTTTTTSDVQEDKNESRSSSSGQDSPRKEQTKRVSLYFNSKKRPSLTSVKTTRSGSLDTTKDKYMDVLGSSERERTNSISSRETASVKPRKSSTSSGNVPWCACWGNGCI